MKIVGKYLTISLCLFLLMKMTSCEPENWEVVDCSDCWSNKPDSANLIVNVTINSQNDSVPLTFYKGYVEDGVIDWLDTATTSELYLYSKVGQLYSVKASYKSGEETIIAFDSEKMKTRYEEEKCSSPCYVIKGGIFDLRLLE